MAFASSRVLRIVTKYSQEVNSPYHIDGKKLIYNPERYGYQYSTKLTKEGFETGARFLNRIPKYKELHPELIDKIKFQRYNFFFVILLIYFIKTRHQQNLDEENRELELAIAKDKAFIGRYSYKQLDFEFNPRIDKSFNL